MTTSPYEQAPEALRLADDLEASSFFPGNRRSRINAGAAELRRIHAENEALHAENEALRAGYNAARLEIESLKTPVIPGVQWQCGPLASGFTTPHPATLTLVASNQPAPDEIINMAREQGLPETEIEGVFRVNADDLCRVAAAILVARTPADSVTAPHQEAQEPVMIYHGDCTIDCGEHGHHHVELLRMIPAGSKLYTAPQPSPTAQAAESVQDMQSVNDAVTIELPPLPDPDLRDVGTKPQEIKEFLKGYATEYARTAIAARAPADSVLEDAAQVEIDLFNDLNRIYGNTLTAYAKELCRLGYRKTNAARKQGETNEH